MLNRTFYWNTIETWLITSIIALVILFILIVSKRIALKYFGSPEKIKPGAPALVVDLIASTRVLFFVVLSLYIALLNLYIPPRSAAFAQGAIIIVSFIQLAIWGNRSILFLLSEYKKKKTKEDAATVTTVTALAFMGRIFLWILILLIGLDQLGVRITTLIAGLGIGGIAVALAVQNILKDLFASLSIIMDKPFVYGDFVVIGEYMGEIEQIGLKTTRLRSISGEQLIFSNSDLLQSRIRNYQRMKERRIVFKIGVAYQTPYEKLAKIPEMIRQAIEKNEKVRIERVHFSGYGTTALLFETAYWISSPDYNLYMDIQQAMNLEIVRRFEQEGIGLAPPA
ncbi:MAG: mechanosensitive ion channel family protein [Syntrophales bacterium]